MKNKTALEALHLGRVAALGCIVCGMSAGCHHIRHQAGMGRKNSHFEAIPLCPDHHQTGGYGVAFHAGPREWERRYGTERELLAVVMAKLEQLYGRYWDVQNQVC
jgi:hypothetical protein